MSKDSPHPTPIHTPANPKAKETPVQPDTLEDTSKEHQHEEHQHHAGCQHGKQHFPVTQKAKIGRNDPCPCGSGKKHKKCCLS